MFQAEFLADGSCDGLDCFDDSVRRMLTGNKNKTSTGKADKEPKLGTPTDVLNFKSASVSPQFKPRVTPEVEDFTVNGVDGTTVTWTVPLDQATDRESWRFSVKLRVGTDAESGDPLNVVWGSDLVGFTMTSTAQVR